MLGDWFIQCKMCAWGTEVSHLGKGWQNLGRASGSQALVCWAKFWLWGHLNYIAGKRDHSIHRESPQIRAYGTDAWGFWENTFYSCVAISRPLLLERGPNSATAWLGLERTGTVVGYDWGSPGSGFRCQFP